jgi:hypothetical protein
MYHANRLCHTAGGLVDINGRRSLVKKFSFGPSGVLEYCSVAGKLNSRSASISVRDGLCRKTSSRDPWPCTYSVSNSASNSFEIVRGSVSDFLNTCSNGLSWNSEFDCLFSKRPSGARISAWGYACFHGVIWRWCSRSGAAMYFTFPPRDSTVARTSGVRLTGENTAREPVESLTVAFKGQCDDSEECDIRVIPWICGVICASRRKGHLPSVPRPPNCRCPNRANGRLMVTMSGVTWRITMVAEGLAGKSCGIFADPFFGFFFRALFGVECVAEVCLGAFVEFRKFGPC